jgi:alpha-tubulin suppressor-like RCC1 family protein/photosystem II stability/assembly factor-like uncharacterized protein
MRTHFFTIALLVFASSAEAQFLGQQSLSESSYVIDQSGNLWAWGRNLYGQLGVGDRTDHNIPMMIPVPVGASKWVLVAGGANFAVAVADSDKLYAWGLNDKGQIGTGIAGGLYVAPVRIQNPPYVTTWKWVSAGADHCEALTTDGRLFAWGNNAQGQLGVGSTDYLITPQPVEFPTGVTSWAAVAAGPGYTMMIAQNGLLYGCGVDSLNTFTPLEGPQLAMTDTFRAYSPLPCIAASYRLESRIDQSYASVDSDIFGISLDGGALESIASVADGGWHSLFLSMDGKIASMGNNTYAQLGIPQPSGAIDTGLHSGLVPLPPGVTQFVAVAAGLRHSLAIGNDGWLYAWGDDSLGELGIGNLPNQLDPVRVLKVCPPVSMTASLLDASNFDDLISFALTVQNTSAALPLTNADAFLVIGGPLAYLDGTPDTNIPSPIPYKDTSFVTWNGTIDKPLFSDISTIYFAYVRAAGSAPVLVHGVPGILETVTPGPWLIQAHVSDSLTGVPISGAEALGLPGVDTSDANGNFKFTIGAGRHYYTIERENYSTLNDYFAVSSVTGFGTLYPSDILELPLVPSDIQGNYATPAPPFIGDSILKVYYPDSLIGYALSRRAIFRTTDSGIHWSTMYEADTDLHDVKFLDPARGWAVGDGGTILSTTDTGETWLSASTGTSENLRGISIIDLDTAWAVGDSGTLLKKSGDTWEMQPPLGSNNLAAIHFFDADHGAVATLYGYYLYTSGSWGFQFINPPPPLPVDLRTIYYAAPGVVFSAGAHGYFFQNTSTYPQVSPQTINSIYFINEVVGFAMADSGASLVTYDGGASWAPLREFPHTGTSVNFFSLAGHGASDNTVLNYNGTPSSVAAIVRGRLTFGNPPEPIMGAKIVRYFTARLSLNPNDTVTATSPVDSIYTNEQGNFVFTGIDNIFHYSYGFNFTDSGLTKTTMFPDTLAHRHEIITLNYNDYTPPPPDTVHASVDQSSEAALSLEVSSSESFARIFYSTPSAGQARLVMQDVLGRTVRTISDGFSMAGPQQTEVSLGDLPAGDYYITLETGEGSLTRKFAVLR